MCQCRRRGVGNVRDTPLVLGYSLNTSGDGRIDPGVICSDLLRLCCSDGTLTNDCKPRERGNCFEGSALPEELNGANELEETFVTRPNPLSVAGLP